MKRTAPSEIKMIYFHLMSLNVQTIPHCLFFLLCMCEVVSVFSRKYINDLLIETKKLTCEGYKGERAEVG